MRTVLAMTIFVTGVFVTAPAPFSSEQIEVESRQIVW